MSRNANAAILILPQSAGLASGGIHSFSKALVDSQGATSLGTHLFYVATKVKKPDLCEVFVKHDNITDIPTYLRLD
jgi:hypothetical protein